LPILGIIAEFNPYHNGHLHFIRSVQQQRDFQAVICVMSGSFVQRGEAAICNKWARTQMALQYGVDLVVEIPFCFAVRSAYNFARGSLQLLHRMGVVSHIAFGSENGQLDKLSEIARTITHETLEYRQQLKLYQKQGLSFPAARSKALLETAGLPLDDVGNIIMQPNNILALEYLRVLKEYAIPIQPITVARIGTGYHSLELAPYASASAIRRAIIQNPSDQRLSISLPDGVMGILKQELKDGRAPTDLTSLEQAILYRLRTISPESLFTIHEVSEGLEHRILQAAALSGSLEELRQSIKSKRFNLTKINRLILYSLLDVTSQQMLDFDQHGPLYIHILGFSTKGRKILQEIKNKSSLPILNRGSEVKWLANDSTHSTRQSMVALDVRASNIYSLLYPNPSARKAYQDFTTSPLVLRN
jgi:predicted nucleotidyltransferase